MWLPRPETVDENSFVDKLVDGLVVLVALVVAILATVGVTALFSVFSDRLPFVGVLTPLALIAGLMVAFLPMYVRFPDAQVGWRDALPGVVFAAVGWAIMQAVFQVYLSVSGGSSGSFFGGVIVVITWLYFSGLVLLTGAVINAVLAGHASPDSLDPPPSAGEGGAETDSFADLPPNDEENASPEPDVSGFPPEEREERVFAAGVPFRVRPLESPRDRVVRRGSGRRSRSRTDRRRGRYVRAVPARGNGDIALDATLRAAAPHQVHRRNGNPNGDGLAVHLRPSDIRERVRERRTGQFLLFLVDASGSMGARGRMIASKGAVLSLLLDAYQKRDRVGMISFRGREATVNLPPTGSVELAARRLDKLPVGGRTPLSAGLVQAHRLLETLRRRDPAARPITVVVTDGKANAALREGAAVDEALALARRLAEEGRSRFVVVDTESEGLFAFGLARRLAEALAADYFRVSDLNAGALLDVVKGTRS
ncbi:MAG: YhjD/YihY/BrkB family envelope integrity protein [Desulfococcaceae bacterium]